MLHDIIKTMKKYKRPIKIHSSCRMVIALKDQSLSINFTCFFVTHTHTHLKCCSFLRFLVSDMFWQMVLLLVNSKWHSRTLSLSLTPSLPLSHTLSPSLIHRHTHTGTHTYRHTHIHTYADPFQCQSRKVLWKQVTQVSFAFFNCTFKETTTKTLCLVKKLF